MGISGDANWGQVVQIAISFIGFIAVIYQLWSASRSIKGATHDRVYGHYHNICKIFIDRPDIRPYFYNNAPMQGVDPQLRAEIEAVSEAMLGLVEHAVVQKENMPRKSWENCWRPYAMERIQKSEMIKEFFEKNRGWYTEAMRNEYASMYDELKSTGKI